MKLREAAAIGVVLGVMHGIVLKEAFDSFAVASFILRGDPYALPLQMTIIVDIVALIGILSYKWWVRIAERSIILLGESLVSEDELEPESWRR